jgi:Restriction endonuclease EcoRV
MRDGAFSQPCFCDVPHSVRRIAIDIKTTYRSFTPQGAVKPFRYTLGSYTSFLRSPTATKNIKYPYMEYSDHWVVGFLYTRREGVPAKVYHRPDPRQLACPYHDVAYFVQEKYKIVGESPGSGNTTNIGSLQSSNIEDFRQGGGPFAAHGKAICDDYWRSYGKTAAERTYTKVETFLAWRQLQKS